MLFARVHRFECPQHSLHECAAKATTAYHTSAYYACHSVVGISSRSTNQPMGKTHRHLTVQARKLARDLKTCSKSYTKCSSTDRRGGSQPRHHKLFFLTSSFTRPSCTSSEMVTVGTDARSSNGATVIVNPAATVFPPKARSKSSPLRKQHGTTSKRTAKSVEKIRAEKRREEQEGYHVKRRDMTRGGQKLPFFQKKQWCPRSSQVGMELTKTRH